MCSQQLAERFNCLAMTIEQPFTDNADRPDPGLGWSSARSKALGGSVLDPIDAILGDLA